MTVDEYLALPYAILVRMEHEGYIGTIPELPGCLAIGDTFDSMLGELQQMKRSWIKIAIKYGDDIPLPNRISNDGNGLLQLRLPVSKHKQFVALTKEKKDCIEVLLWDYIDSYIKKNIPKEK